MEEKIVNQLRLLLVAPLERPSGEGAARFSSLQCLPSNEKQVLAWYLRLDGRKFSIADLASCTPWQWLPSVDYVPAARWGDAKCLEAMGCPTERYGVLVATVRQSQVIEITRFPAECRPAPDHAHYALM